MESNMRCNLPGTFLTRNLGQGRWRLSRGEPEPVEVLVLGAYDEQGQVILLRPDVDVSPGSKIG